MTTDEPTILATSGGLRPGERTYFEFTPLTQYAVDLAGVAGRAPRVCTVTTAGGDAAHVMHGLAEAGRIAGYDHTNLQLFGMPNVADVEAHLLSQDVIWVMGGSVVNLLAVWRAHGLDAILHRAWQAGVVLTGVSAGSICWYQGGTTDSFGPQLAPVIDGLAFLPYGNGVHYDSEERRRPLIHRLVADGTLGPTHCTDDGVGLLYRGTELVEAVAESGAGAYVVQRDGDTVREDALDVRRLPA
ncbi:peptidase E [Allobranchiibius sp. GilTou73]|uniref:Type 1 glutamine amidotransferase-like domain-containing protein n=1 Tax=Allobranchiibius sp. GilTou73 TaxID=2904523 RepID=UPI001F32F277|nr:peptidase E [Allobranchiibius sp. GilTou73]UIJ35699.1 peptidase E [Allobranchiibius sp. GilTou73]